MVSGVSGLEPDAWNMDYDSAPVVVQPLAAARTSLHYRSGVWTTYSMHIC